jgi:uncharacterized protein (DUF58 family)
VAASTPERILQRLDWQVVRRLDGLLQGDYRSLLYGYGVDFADLREYQPGDDVRYIDWNVTARLGAPYVRQYIEDRDITAWFLLDLSPSLEFGDAEANKRKTLTEFTAVMARLLTRHGNHVGAMMSVSEVERIIPARSGRLQVLRLLDLAARVQGRHTSGLTDLSVLIRTALNAVKRRSVVLLVSDFISKPGWEAPLALLNQRHEVLAICVRDPREVEIPDVGAVILEDAETGEQLYVDTHDPGFRSRFRKAADQREADLRAAFKRAGVDALWISPDEDLVTAFIRFAGLRQKRARAH